MFRSREGTFRVQDTRDRPKITVTVDGRGVVAHAGARLLTDLAEATGLTEEFCGVLAPTRERSGGHEPGRVAVDLAVMLGNGGETISDLAALRDQPALFGAVASTATAWRVLDSVDAAVLNELRSARAVARERAWLQRAELTGRSVPAVEVAGVPLPGLVLDVDASCVDCHSEKQGAAPTFKGGFGYHPILVFLDNTREALAGILRPGNAGSNTAADHIMVLDAALAQIPDEHRHGTPILIRADSAGCTQAFLAHLRGLREQHMQVSFSVGFAIDVAVRTAIQQLPAGAWTPAIDIDSEIRDGAWVAEITGLLDLAGYPEGMRVIVRRERPHPGAQLSLFDHEEGFRHLAFATDTPYGRGGAIAFLEARHRAHARVEDRIRTGKDTGIGRFPSRLFAVNQAWLELALTAIDLLAWTQTILLDGELAMAEPKALRYRLLHVAARITRGARRTWLRINEHWPWRHEIAAAFARLTALALPVT
jgi:hypothetical protein